MTDCPTWVEANISGHRGEHVFPSSAGDKPLVGVNRAWEKVRILAGIPDVRLHDLRHSFATFAVESGAPLYHVGRALGHSKTTTTERYAHPSDAGARAVASEVAARFVTAPAPANDAAGDADCGPCELTPALTPVRPALRTPLQAVNLKELLKTAARTRPAS